MSDFKSLVAEMTLEEKAGMCSGLNFWYLKGIERLGIPSIMVADGPHGLRKQTGGADHAGLQESMPATCFPTASALAATWNRSLLKGVGRALGEECRQEKVGVILGPGVNIKRSPLCGRNFEYFSEDPCLAGALAGSFINGVQSQGIGTSLKHYAVNNQEYRRMTIDTVVDERALREIYLPAFETAVKEARPWTVMCSYNKINGTYACEHEALINDILKQEWGYTGVVVTDWGAMNDRVVALQAGVELEMPGVNNGNTALIEQAVRSGALEEMVLDGAVERILELVFKAAETLAEDYTYDAQAHHALARQAAEEGAVLLKNVGPLLPLAAGSRIALVGRFAREPRYQGAGSSLVNPTRLDNLYDELAALAGADNLVYAPGYTRSDENSDRMLIEEALKTIEGVDAVVICAGLTDLHEVEGLDRPHMKLPAGHDALITRLAAAHRSVVVVLSNGAPVEMPWAGAVPAILESYLGGQAGAGAIADILTGRVNPSGKLAETFPLRGEDSPARPFPGGPAVVDYRESIYVGYRYYDKVGQDVLFPFGHGLSYTTFTYSGLDVRPSGEGFIVALRVRNNGPVRGMETVQVYVCDPVSTVFRPDKELKDFAKIELGPDEEEMVKFDLGCRAFAYYDSGQGDWVVEPGEFEILVGASSRDIRLAVTVQVGEGLAAVLTTGGQASLIQGPGEKSAETASGKPGVLPAALSHLLSAYSEPSAEKHFEAKDFTTLLGRPLPPNRPPRKGEYTLNTPVCELDGSLAGRLFIRLVRGQVKKMTGEMEGTPSALLMQEMINQMPLRGLLMQGGFLTRPRLEAILLIINGRLFQGLAALLGVRRSTVHFSQTG